MKRRPSTDVYIENRHKGAPKVDEAACADAVAWFIRKARRLRGKGAVPWSSVTVLLVGDEESAGAHRMVFDDPTPTDVITLTYEAMPGMEIGISGELIVNVDRAWSEGVRRGALRRWAGWTPQEELALYLAHGVDHLTGADDHEMADRRRMRARELVWVRGAKLRGWVPLLMKPPKA